jgi:hypothetical protein
MTVSQAKECLRFVDANLRQLAWLFRILTFSVYIGCIKHMDGQLLFLSFWSTGAIAYTWFHYWRSWVPWAAYLYQISKGRMFQTPDSPIQAEIRAYLRRPAIRRQDAFLGLRAVTLPWIVWGISQKVVPAAFSTGHLQPVEFLFFGLPFGLMDAKAWILFGMRRATSAALRDWNQLVQSAEERVTEARRPAVREHS